jgi:predicted Zn-dependent peptidase
MRDVVKWRRLVLSGVLIALAWLGFPSAAFARSAPVATDAQPAEIQVANAQLGHAKSIQPYLDRVAGEITEFKLNNGMKFIVMERHEAPVVSFMLYANVGAAAEEDGKTGIAHYLEHLAFKGTTRIGTRDYPAEKQVLDQLDRVFDELLAAQAAGDEAKAAQLEQQLKTLQEQAASYVDQNKLGQIIEQAGGRGLNATTSADATRYFYSLPSNKLELWMSLESERFLDPVFREFYEEKEVILEERRMRVDNSPIGRLVEVFLENSFEKNPYRRPVIGYQEDLRVATRKDIAAFFQTYYGPTNLIAAVVGDVDPMQVKQMAEAYFGRYQSRSHPTELTFTEPVQTAPKTFELTLPTEPWYMEGYHRPSIRHPDHVIYGMIDSLLVGGRTARLYKSLVEQSQVALDVGSANGFPGDRYDNTMMFYGLTAPNHTVDELGTLIQAELKRLQDEPVSEEELDRVKTQARAGLLGALSSNSGMASLLTEYEAKTGNWRSVFKDLQALEAVTAQDVQRVAKATFVPNNRTVGKLLSQS